MKKTRGKSSLFLCFRPVVIGGGKKSAKPVGKRSSGESVVTYISVTRDIPVEGEDDACGRKKGSHQSFARIVKAVENLPYKNDRNGKSRRALIRSGNSNRLEIQNVSGIQENSENLVPGNSERSTEDEDQKTESIFSSSSLSSFTTTCSSATDTCSSSWLNPQRKNGESIYRREKSLPPDGNIPPGKNLQENQKNEKSRNYSSGLYLMMISLSVLLIWGKVCAILWTSTWLYFAPHRKADLGWSESEQPPASMAKLREMQSKEDKKRVVMEGLLERSRSRI